jgi:3-oxoacyl-[acyl-carrier protein] reductase
LGFLDNKVVAITGASSGLGRAYAEAMAAEGARLLLNDVDTNALAESAAAAAATAARVERWAGSVGSWSGGERLVEACLEAYGRIDVLVSNAGILRQDEVWDLKEADLDDLYNVLLKGVVAAGSRAAREMKSQRAGCILNVTSRAAYGSYGRSLYAALKGAVASLTYSWALELAPYGVRVNALSPSAQTAMMAANTRFAVGGTAPTKGTAPRRTGTAAEVAPLAVYLASDEGAWVTGQAIALGGDLLALVAHPKDMRQTFKPGGWSVADLVAYFRSTAGGRLEPVGIGSAAYPWPDGLRNDE